MSARSLSKKCPSDNIPASLEILHTIPHVKSAVLLPEEVHEGYKTVRICFAPPDLRVTPRYGNHGNLADQRGVIGTYRPPAGMGNWTVDIHIPNVPTSVETLSSQLRYGTGTNYGTGVENLCWKLVEIADAKYLNESIYGAGFTGHIYYEGIGMSQGKTSVVEAEKIFEQAKDQSEIGNRQQCLAFCIEERIAGMLRQACLVGDVAAAFAIVYDIAGQTHYRVPKEYSHIKGTNIFYQKKKKGVGIFEVGNSI